MYRSGYRPCSNRIVSARIGAVVALLALVSTAWAETARFSATVNGVERQAVVDVVRVGDKDYVPVLSLTRQLGGEGRVVGTRVQLDVAGHSAFAGIDEREVNASAKRFDLAYPILRHDAGALVALEEVVSFFDQGFKLTVTQRQKAVPEAPPEPMEDPASLVEPLPEEALLEPIAVPKPARTLDKMIVVDAGHGGGDVGIEGPGGAQEKAVALAVAEALQRALADVAGLDSTLTREGDRPMSLAERRSAATEAKADLLVSLHASGSPGQQSNGIGIFYAPDGGTMGDSTAERLLAAHASGNAAISKVVAEAIQKALQEDGQRPVRVPREIPLRLMRNADVPGVLIEVGYLSNPVEERMLQESTEQQRMARAIAAGVQAAFTQLQKGAVE